VSERERAAGAFTHPAVWLAIGLLVLNDHVLKRVATSWLTGKLSDFAGLAFFPLLLDGAIELALDAVGRYRGPSRARVVVCIALTGASFAFMKLTSIGETIYGLGLGLAQWPFRSAFSVISGEGLAPFRVASMVRDATDLIALFALIIPYAIGTARARRA